jgi:hypothetical protein
MLLPFLRRTSRADAVDAPATSASRTTAATTVARIAHAGSISRAPARLGEPRWARTASGRSSQGGAVAAGFGVPHRPTMSRLSVAGASTARPVPKLTRSADAVAERGRMSGRATSAG